MERPKRLSATFVKGVSAPGRYGDGRGSFGLSLLVKESKTGRLSKSWSQRLRDHGKPFNIGLGAFPVVSLAKARELALANAQTIEEGIDPRDKATVPTFAESVERTIEILRPQWKVGSKTEKQMRYLLGEYALPVIAQKPIDAIVPLDIIGLVGPLALDKAETARKLRVQLNQVFKWAVSQGLRGDNPADGNISNALPKMGVNQHRRALPHGEVAAAVRAVRRSGAWPGTKLALEFLVLTATRSSEIRLATWDEVDWQTSTWTVPAERMKSTREHRVPLCRRAMEILHEARDLGDSEGLVFPSPRGKALSDGTIGKLLKENGFECVPHGFRSSFRDWCAEQNVERQLAETALAHTVTNQTEAAYFRSDVFDLRRQLMESWSSYLTTSDSG